eukprot:234324-Amphidinium_carterae.1
MKSRIASDSDVNMFARAALPIPHKERSLAIAPPKQTTLSDWAIFPRVAIDSRRRKWDRLVSLFVARVQAKAMAMLLELFIGTAQPTLPLASTARCVCFAAPMCYGSAEGHDVKEDFAQFVRARAVNYIYGGDPVPRLWSELDLEGFMRFFVDRLSGQIPSALRPVVDWAVGPGGIVQRVQDVLQRPDVIAGANLGQEHEHLSPTQCIVI